MFHEYNCIVEKQIDFAICKINHIGLTRNNYKIVYIISELIEIYKKKKIYSNFFGVHCFAIAIVID